MNENGGLFVAYTRGLVSAIVPRGTYTPLRRWYADEERQMRAPGYGELGQRKIPFAPVARAYYANGYFNAGIDAERLRDLAAARVWFALALTEVPDSPTIVQALVHLNELTSS